MAVLRLRIAARRHVASRRRLPTQPQRPLAHLSSKRRVLVLVQDAGGPCLHRQSTVRLRRRHRHSSAIPLRVVLWLLLLLLLLRGWCWWGVWLVVVRRWCVL